VVNVHAANGGDSSDDEVTTTTAAPKWLLTFLAMEDKGDQFLFLQVRATPLA